MDWSDVDEALFGHRICEKWKAELALLLNKGYAVDLTDMKEIADKEELEKIGIHVYDNGHPSCLIYERIYEFVVKNPGIKYTAPLIDFFVKNQVKIYTEIEIASWYLKNSHYGELREPMEKQRLLRCCMKSCKSITMPKLPAISDSFMRNCSEDEAGQHDIALELSNFQLLGVESFKPDVAVVCNLAPDYLDYMNSVEEYYESKFRIAMNQTENDWFLRNVDDELVMKYTKRIKAELIDFSLIRQDVDLYLKDGIV